MVRDELVAALLAKRHSKYQIGARFRWGILKHTHCYWGSSLCAGGEAAWVEVLARSRQEQVRARPYA